MSEAISRLNAALRGRYSIERPLGEGAMATVHLARDERHDRKVAIKVLRPELASVVGGERFIAEIRTTANLVHPHILPLFDSGEVDGFLFYVMPYVDGETLRDRLDRERQLPIDEAVDVAVQIAGALAYAHGCGVVHRDVKPGNILVSEGHPLLADFGIARAIEREAEDPRLTGTGHAVGTLNYMSPEQATGEAEIGAEADIYALGCVLHEMLTGQPPFSGPTARALMARHVLDEPPPIRTVRGDVPQAVEAAIRKAMAKAPADRYRTATAFAEALGSSDINDEPPTLDRPDRPPSELRRETVAVLPFGHITGEDAAMFAAGLHQDLLTQLSRSRTLTVISRTSVSRYRDTELTLPEIGRTLGAGTIIEGDVQQSGERLRLNVRLVDAGTDHHMWAETFDRELSAQGLFDIQSELAERIADSLRAELGAGRRERIAEGPPTHDLEAYRLHATGRALLDRRTEGGMRDGLRCFHEALERDPAYAPAWVGVADVWGFLTAYGFEASDTALQEAEAAADRALELDPGSAEAHASLGLISYVRRDGRAALRSLARAIELGPSYALPHSLSAYVSSLVGRGEDTLMFASRAVELDPLSAESAANLSLGHLFSGSRETAVLEARRVQTLQPEYTTGAFYEALAQFELGELARVVSLLDGVPVEWAGHGAPATIALALAVAGNREGALRRVEQIGSEDAPFVTGLVTLALGETDEAFGFFNRVQHWDDWSSLAVHHLYRRVWEPVRDDPRYGALRRRALAFWGMDRDANPPGN